MKKLILTLLSIFALLQISEVSAQSKYYEKDGKIMDSLAYEEYKQSEVARLGKVFGKKMYIMDSFETIRQNEDSIILKQHWNITDNPKKTLKEINAKQSLVGQPFPFDVLGLDDEIDIESLKGKPMLINLWFVGCAPCLDEMPILNEIKKEYGDKVHFVALSYSKDKQVRKLLAKRPFNFTHYTGIKELAKKLKITSYPNNILIDKEGNVVEVMGGIPYTLDKETKELVIGDGKELREKLEALL